uniref:PIN domain-containing protein n=1 Tax=Cyanothece sp. (strain PCC 7425 / ATCC 29141) TaxID=395961 RepID=B8HJP5_CYAP4
MGVLALGDREDAHVLEVAIAGRANLLSTANFKFVVERVAIAIGGMKTR